MENEQEKDDEVWERNEEVLKAMWHSANESDRGITLIIAAHLDDCLRRLIESFLIDSKDVKELFEGPFAPFGTLSAKTRVAHMMGLITKEEVKRIDAVRAVRNVFAHTVEASFEHPKIQKLCEKPPIYDGRLCERDAFLHMAQNAVFPILYRDLHEGKSWKRKELVLGGSGVEIDSSVPGTAGTSDSGRNRTNPPSDHSGYSMGVTKSLAFRLVRTLVLLCLTAFTLLQLREYLISQLGLPIFQIVLVPVLMIAIWLGLGDWLAELRAKERKQESGP